MVLLGILLLLGCERHSVPLQAKLDRAIGQALNSARNWQNYMTGPDVKTIHSAFDRDCDGDVDLRDWSLCRR